MSSIHAQARRAGRQSTNGAVFEALTRAGFVARGAVYAIIGLLAIQVAMHAGGAPTNQRGALETIQKQPFGHWLLIPGTIVLAGYYLVVGREAGSRYKTGIRTSVLALGLTLAGYFAVYLITPYDIHWHLRSSLNRLFLQVWPSAIFLFFLAVRTPEQTLAD